MLKPKYYSALGFTLLAIIAIAMRFHHLDFESLFMDEIRQVSYYQLPIIDIINAAATQQQPPLDYWLGRFAFTFSQTDFTARVPAALFGIGAVILIAHLATKFSNALIGLFTGLILAIHPYHIYFSQEARPYSIAIFFVIALLVMLDFLYSEKEIKWVNYLCLFFTTFLLLISRTLSPLVMVFLLGLVLSVQCFRHLLFKQVSKEVFKRYLYSLTAIIFAMLCYIPFFLKILNTSKQYVKDSSLNSLQWITEGLKKIDLSFGWKAFVVQTEPLTWGILVLVIGGLLKIAVNRAKGQPLILPICAILLPAALLLHLFLHQSKTGAPFRTPYPVYLLPLSLLISAYSLGVIQKWIFQHTNKTSALTMSALIGIGILFLEISASTEFKQMRIKNDWRGLSKKLENNYDSQHIMISEILSPVDQWDPGYYGFERYYHKNLPRIRLLQISSMTEKLHKLSLRPALILFRKRHFYLTPSSKYGILPIGYPDTPPLSKILTDSDLEITDLTGFSIVSLKTNHTNLASSTLYLLEKILAKLDQDSSVTHMHLIAAFLAQSCGFERALDHLIIAQKISRPSQKTAVSLTINHLKQIKVVKNCINLEHKHYEE